MPCLFVCFCGLQANVEETAVLASKHTDLPPHVLKELATKSATVTPWWWGLKTLIKVCCMAVCTTQHMCVCIHSHVCAQGSGSAWLGRSCARKLSPAADPACAAQRWCDLHSRTCALNSLAPHNTAVDGVWSEP